jgi:ubiquinone/menaquinone biosynthesis C-methylase UbiE
MLDEAKVWEPFTEDYTAKVFCVSEFPAKRRAILAGVKAGRVLGIGCGPVTFLEQDLVRDRRMTVFAADFSLTMLKNARRTITPHRNLLFLAADNRCLPFPDNSIDTVISVNSILPEARADVDLMFGEVSRILRPGGRLVAVLPAFETTIMARDHWGIEIGVDEVNHREYDTTGWQCYYTGDDIAALMPRHKLTRYRYKRLYFTRPDELAEIRKIYGDQISTDCLLEYPLFEHLVVANRES